jgi:hypothetical protein
MKRQKWLAISTAGNVLLVFGFIWAVRGAVNSHDSYVRSLERLVDRLTGGQQPRGGGGAP